MAAEKGAVLPRGGRNGSGQRVGRSTRNVYFEVNSPPRGVQSSLVVVSWHGHHGDTGRGTQEDTPASQRKVGPSCGLTGTRIHWVVTKHHHFQQERQRDLLCLWWWDNQNGHIWELGELRGERHTGRCWPFCTPVAAGLEKAGAGVRTVLGPHLP